MTPDEVRAKLLADARLSVLLEGGVDASDRPPCATVAEVDGVCKVSLYACCAVTLAKLTHYAKAILPVTETYMFKQRSTGFFVAFLTVN